MKNALVCFTLCFAAAAAATPMSHVVGIRDSRTIIVDTNGVTSAITLKNVETASEEETQAADYLRRTLANTWVFIDSGDVYRSPDALYVNADMRQHPWRTMRYLGELDLGVRAKGVAAGNKVTAPSLPELPARATPAPRRITSRPKRNRR